MFTSFTHTRSNNRNTSGDATNFGSTFQVRARKKLVEKPKMASPDVVASWVRWQLAIGAASKSTSRSGRVLSMNEQQVRNLESGIARFAERVGRIWDMLQGQPGSYAWMRQYLRNELDGWAPSLAQLRLRLETAIGVENPARLDAQAQYYSATKELIEAYDMPDDGSGLIGNTSDWRPRVPPSQADRIEAARKAVDASLFEYAAP
jgi:hypothetical protein